MKAKLLLTLLALVSWVGAWAQTEVSTNTFEPEAGTKYVLKLHGVTNPALFLSLTTVGNTAGSQQTNGTAFTITKSEDGYTFQADNGDFLGKTEGWKVATTETKWNIVSYDDGTVALKNGSTYIGRDDVGAGQGLYTDKDGDKTCYWDIEDASAYTFSYTVRVLGTDEGRIIIDGTEYANGATIEGLATALTQGDIQAKNIAGKTAVATLNGGVISATYYSAGDAIDFTDKIVKLGEKTQAIVPNTQWYVMSQIRGGESAVIDNGSNIARDYAANTLSTVFPEAGVLAESMTKYLVRFLSTNVDGAYQIQFGTGSYWNGVTPTSTLTDSKFYFVHGATQNTGGADPNGIAIINTPDLATYGSRLDNNAPGTNSYGTVVTWGSGDYTEGTNNVFYLYPASLEDVPVANITFNYEGAATYSVTVKYLKGETPTLPVAIPNYVNHTISPALAAVTGDATYTITTSYNEAMPFEPNSEKNYNLNINRSPNLKVYTEGEEIKTVAGTAVTYENQNNFMWQFEGDWLNGFKLKNKAADKYVTFGSVNPANKYKATLTETPAEGAIYELVVNNGKNYFKIFGTTNNAYISNNGGAGTTFLTNWNSASNIGDAGAQFLISDAEVVPFDLTTIKAEAVASLPANIPALYSVDAIATATAAINNVTCGADQASIDAALAAIAQAKADLLKTAEGKKVAFKSLPAFSTRDAEYYLTAEDAGTQMTSNTQLTKNAVYELTYVDAAKAYTVKALANETYLPKTGNASTAIVTTDNAANAGHYTFTGTSNDDQRVIITNTNGSAVSDSQGGIHLDGSKKIVVWGPTSGASQWVIEPVSDEKWAELNPAYDWAAYEVLYNQIKAMTFGDKLGQYADKEMEEYGDGKRISDMIPYFDADFDDKDEEYYDSDMEDMQWILANLQFNMPKEGQFFRIKASSAWIDTPTYLKGTQNASNRAEFTQDNDEINGTETIFCYYWENNGAGKYLVNYGNGMTAANNSTFMGMKQYPSTTAIAFQAATTGEKVGKYNIKFAGSRFLYTNKGLYADAGNGSTAEGYNFELEEVSTLPVKISAAGYATLYAPAALVIPAGVKAYTLAENGETLKATELDGVIPANTGVVLEGAAGTYNFNITTGGEGESCLSGMVPTKAKTGTPYTLANGSEGIGFYQYTGATLGGFKAYYQAASEAKGFGISFEDEETGIANVGENVNENTSIYNLAGQRLQKTEKGILIVGGKKVLF